MIRKIKEILNRIHETFKAGDKVIYDDPDFGETDAVVEETPRALDDNVKIKVIERPMIIYVPKYRLKLRDNNIFI